MQTFTDGDIEEVTSDKGIIVVKFRDYWSPPSSIFFTKEEPEEMLRLIDE